MPVFQVNAADKLNTSVGQWYAWLTGSKNGDDAAGPLSNVVDVRDLAHAHVQAISLEEAGSKRIAVSNQPYTWQLCLDEVYGNDAVMKSWPKLPKGRTGADKLEDQNREPRQCLGDTSQWNNMELKLLRQFLTIRDPKRS